MQFELVSPERALASMEVNAVQIPASDGDMTAMANHAPVITTLRPGILKIETSTGEQSYVVTGGFAEISSAGTSVLAEVALPAEDVSKDILAGWISDAEAAAENATEENRAATAKAVADMQALETALGL